MGDNLFYVLAIIVMRAQASLWLGVSVLPIADETTNLGTAIFCNFDDATFEFSPPWNCSFKLFDPNLSENYYLEVGPIVAINDHSFVFGQYGGTSFQSSSLIFVDTVLRTCHQGPVSNTGLYHSLNYDAGSKMIIGVRDIETWTIVYEEVDVMTLKPGQTLFVDKSNRGNAPQGFGAYFNTENRLFGHVVEVDYFHNFWQLLNFSSIPGESLVYHQFPTDWPPATLTYYQKNNHLVGLYQNINNASGGEPQAFFIDPVSGDWPLQGTQVVPLIISSVPINGSPVQDINGEPHMLVMALSDGSSDQDDCKSILLNFNSLSSIKEGNVPCSPFGYSNWNWV